MIEKNNCLTNLIVASLPKTQALQLRLGDWLSGSRFGSLTRILTFIFLSSFSTQASAEYCATGTIVGNECKGFIIESCAFIDIHAVEGSDGQLYEVAQCYEDVSDCSDRQDGGRCWITTESRG